ncbi:MAG: hypothetical protein ABIU54_09030 [Candidatus Eisenbacteria bacterium]
MRESIVYARTVTGVEQAPAEQDARSGSLDDMPVHLVYPSRYPVALCGATVIEPLTRTAAGRDRCTRCLAVAASEKRERAGE